MRDGLDDSAEREVIVGHVSARGQFSGRAAMGVVVGQAHNLELRHVAFGFEPFQFGDKTVSALSIGIIQVEAAKMLIEVAFERFNESGGGLELRCVEVYEFTITPIADAGFARAVPQ